MPPKRAPKRSATPAASGTPKRPRGTATQPIEVDESQSSQLSLRPSPRKALAAAASQASNDAPFESQLRDAVPEVTIVPPLEGSKAATVATTEAAAYSDGEDEFDKDLADNFEGIDWSRLPLY
jgi:hypothetical protein